MTYKNKNEKRQMKGFTIIELLIVVAIVGVISAVAIPSYQSFLSKSKVTTTVSSLHGALLLAHSEALKRGVSVTICRSEDVVTCSGSSSIPLTNTGWADGWIIFTDNNSNGVLESSATPPEVIVSAQNRLSRDVKDVSIIPNAGLKFITFNSTGQVFGNAIQFEVRRPVTDSDSSHDRFICIASGGRVRVSNVAC